MNTNSTKIKLVFNRFLLIAVSIVLGYTLLNWLVFKKLGWFSLTEEAANLWIPMLLPWIPLILWLRPRIKLLNLKRKKGDLPGFYIFIAAFAIIVPTLIAQAYLETAAGKLTPLDNISQIEQQSPTKYYTLHRYYIDRKNYTVYKNVEISGKYNQYYIMNLHFVMAILTSPADTASSSCYAWYGVNYHKQISNRLALERKAALFEEYLVKCKEDLAAKDLNAFEYLDRIDKSNNQKGFVQAIERNAKYWNSPTTVLLPRNEPFESRNGHKLAWVFLSFVIGTLIWLIMVLVPKFDEEALEKFTNGHQAARLDIKSVFIAFIPRNGFYITPILVNLNILVFAVIAISVPGFLSFKTIDLLKWGANYGPYVEKGEWWRLLTSVFLHNGFMHLAANMYGLLFVGFFLEPKLGSKRYIWIYLATGLLASLSSIWWHPQSPSVGASGAIFGLYGAFLAFLLTQVFPKDFNKAFLLSTIVFIGFNLVMGMAGGIDNAAHIGGFVSGFIIGLVLAPRIKSETEEQQERAEE